MEGSGQVGGNQTDPNSFTEDDSCSQPQGLLVMTSRRSLAILEQIPKWICEIGDPKLNKH